MAKVRKNTEDFKNAGEMVAAHRIVLKSLIDKAGTYKSGEVVEINNGFGKQLNYMKIVLESYKLMGIKPKKNELTF
jgi:hypothetical protein